MNVLGWGARETVTHVHADIGAIHASGNDFAIVNEDASDRCFVRFESQFSL